MLQDIDGRNRRPETYGTAETPGGAFPVLDVHLSAGPILKSGLRDDVIGRVIGVYQSPLEETPGKRASGSA